MDVAYFNLGFRIVQRGDSTRADKVIGCCVPKMAREINKPDDDGTDPYDGN